MILIKPKDQSATKTLLVLVGRDPGRPQCENDTGGCGTLFLMGRRVNLQLSMSRAGYNLVTSILRVVVISSREQSQKLLVKACFFFPFKNKVHVPLKGVNECDCSKSEIPILPRSFCENYN